MSNMNDSQDGPPDFRRSNPLFRRPPGPPALINLPSRPTLEDFQSLAQAYQQWKVYADEQTRALHEKNSELAIKDEVIQRQTHDVKQLEVELVFAKAAVAQAQKMQEESGDQSWQERYSRLQAEMDNLRKRWEQRFANELAEARNHILLDMLPLADHLDLALLHAGTKLEQGDNSTTTEQLRALLGNIEATRRAFVESLRRYGVERMVVIGQPFDPNRHEAIHQIESSEVAAGHVVQEVQAGYVNGDRLLRPARVILSK